MNRFKKTALPAVVILLAVVPLAAVLMLSSCLGGNEQNTDKAESDTRSEQTETEEVTTLSPETDPVTDVPTEAPTEVPTAPTTDAPTEPETDPEREPLELAFDFDPSIPDKPTEITDVKALWISQFDLNGVYTNGKKQRGEEDFRSRITAILQNVYDLGFNTIFLQVRPNADSMYPSEYYPPSVYVTGSYANDFSYDPLPIIIEEAHSYGFSIHAWINPMRSVTPSEMKQISEGYTVRQWYEDDDLRGRYLVEYGGRIYLNPAYAEVRDLIVYGAREILQKYEFDGLHMDDYFYPSEAAAAFDADAYAAYKAEGGKASLQDFRFDSLSNLVASLYRMTKKQNSDLLFGISPAGNIANVRKQYADVDRWCAEPGFIDYILPQDYFGFEHQTCAFDKVCHTWENIIKTDYVSMMVGMTFGKALSKTDQYAGSGKNEWANHTDILKRSVEYTTTVDKCCGVSVFCYQYFFDPVSGTSVAGTKAERENFLPALMQATWVD